MAIIRKHTIFARISRRLLAQIYKNIPIAGILASGMSATVRKIVWEGSESETDAKNEGPVVAFSITSLAYVCKAVFIAEVCVEE